MTPVSNGGTELPEFSTELRPTERQFEKDGQRIEELRDALAQIEQLVRHEWRLKDHSPTLVLNSIEQVLYDL